MSDDAEFEGGVFEREIPAANAAAAELAMATADRARANAFLDSQTAIADLQREHLHEQRALQISHLRWRRFNDWMRAAWQTMLGIVCALIVAVIGVAMWNASEAEGLVVNAFSVPPDFARRGMGGDVIAGDVTGRLAAIRRVVVANSYSSTASVSQRRTDEIKVEIPDTGISFAEAWRYLRDWLGHARHLSGSLRETVGGRIVLSASLDDGTVFSARGAPSDLSKLEQQVAVDVFGDFDPVNRIVYLIATGHNRAGFVAATRYMQVAKGPLARAAAFSLWSVETELATGDLGVALARDRIGIRTDPNVGVDHVVALRLCNNIGDDECALGEAGALLALREEDQPAALRGAGFAGIQGEGRDEIELLSGDFSDAAGLPCTRHCSPLFEQVSFVARLHEITRARRMLADAIAAGKSDGEITARFYIDAAAQEWLSAVADAKLMRARLLMPDGSDVSSRYLETIAETRYDPLQAYAQAHAALFGAAHRTIDRTPGDCVPCNTARGEIDALQRRRGAAAWWFARAVTEAPSVPYADTDWGDMLLHRGDYDGAIAKFTTANLKGPHFADPLEMWGEALMQKNRSDVALAKFEEANKYAPHWGRLHLEWGKAFLWSGDKTAAGKQFAIAARLDLSTQDRVQLRTMKQRI